jgi:ABC-type sugar transport system substrate-binding protein
MKRQKLRSKAGLVTSLTAILALVLAGCGGGDAGGDAAVAGDDGEEVTTSAEGESAEGKRIVVFMPPGTDGYLAEWQRGLEAAADDFGVDLTIVENNFDQAEQDLQVQQELGRGSLADMYVWWPVDNAAGVASLAALGDSDAPVMQVNQLPVEEAEGLWDLYAGVDDRLSGRTAGELLVEARDALAENTDLHSDGGNALAFQFPTGYSAAVDRLAGFEEGIEGSGIEIIDSANLGFDETSGYEGGLTLIPANRSAGIDLVYAQNDALASGVIIALEEAGYTVGVDGDVAVVGGNCHSNLDDLRDEKQYATGLQAARLEGMQAILVADAYFKGGGAIEPGEYFAPDDPDEVPEAPVPPQQYNFLPNPVMTGEDLDETRLGGFDAEDLCTY